MLRKDLIRQASLIGILSMLLLISAYVAVWLVLRRSQRLEVQAAEAERLAYLGTLASGLAHEIRNPLNSLNLNMQMLEEEIDEHGSAPTGKRLLSITRSELSRLERLVSDFLAYAKPRPLELEEVPAVRPLERMREVLAGEIQKRQVQIEIEDRSGGARDPDRSRADEPAPAQPGAERLRRRRGGGPAPDAQARRLPPGPGGGPGADRQRHRHDGRGAGARSSSSSTPPARGAPASGSPSPSGSPAPTADGSASAASRASGTTVVVELPAATPEPPPATGGRGGGRGEAAGLIQVRIHLLDLLGERELVGVVVAAGHAEDLA